LQIADYKSKMEFVMSRFPTGEAVTVKPQNNAFTVLSAAAAVIVLVGLIALFLRAKELLPEGGLFGQ
jgi:hypothetical protein